MIHIIIIILVIFLFIKWFNRHPYISPDIKNTPNNVVLSPCYGTIKKIIHENNKTYIMIFILSYF